MEKALRHEKPSEQGYINSIKKCGEYCVEKNYEFAGVQVAGYSGCFCGNLRPDPGLIVSDEECEISCPENTSEKCGGYEAMTIYKADSDGNFL